MPILDYRSLEFFSHSPEQTRRIGIRLGGLLQTGDVICLEGDLGAGKTTFVQGIAQGWGSLDAVSSPTYVIVNEYRHPEHGCLYHMDAYRLEGSMDAEMLDIEAMLDNGPLVIEWAERIKPVLPEDHMWVTMKYMHTEQRYMFFVSHGKRHEQITDQFRQSIIGRD